jgi:hypothetical protein
MRRVMTSRIADRQFSNCAADFQGHCDLRLSWEENWRLCLDTSGKVGVGQSLLRGDAFSGI